MNGSDSLHLDEHLARLLAAYDQGMDAGNDPAPTLDAPFIPNFAEEKPVGPLSGSQVNQGSLSGVMPGATTGNPDAASGSPAAVPEQPRIGRFELRKQLGRGGCGIVFLAYDPRLKREIALKILRPELMLSPDARRRLLREATAAASFDHPNLVPVYEAGEIGPVCFIGTVFCPGQTLSEWLERQVFPVPVRQAARLVAQLAEAVQHAHDRFVLHRDLKPNNIVLQEVKTDSQAQEAPPGACPLRGDYFIPRVVDFGLAKLTDQGPGETATRQVVGTPKYMSPEQAQARHEDIGPEADVYALGVILYEMLTGRPPYEGATDVEVLRLAIEGDLTLPRASRKEIPRDLEAICLKAMARTPARRYRTALDLADDIRRFLEGLPTIARPLNSLGRAARWLRRNDQLFALIVLSAICSILLAIGMLNAYQNSKARDVRKESQVRDAERTRLDSYRDYARLVRNAFLAWQAGDSQQMAESLRDARLAAAANQETPEFALSYLSQVGQSEKASVRYPGGKVQSLGVSPLGPWIATGHADGTLAIWNREALTVIEAVKSGAAPITHAAFLHGSRIATVDGNASLRVWRMNSAGRLQPDAGFPSMGEEICALAASANGKRLVVGTRRGRCAVWDVTTGKSIRSWEATSGEPVFNLAMDFQGRTIAASSRNGSVRLWAIEGEGPIAEAPGSGRATALWFVPDEGGPVLAAGNEAGAVRLFDLNRRESRVLAGQGPAIVSLCASPDGKWLAAGGRDGAIGIWSVQSGKRLKELRGHEGPAPALAFAPDGRTVYSAADDGLFKSWDAIGSPEGQTLRDLPAAVTNLATRSEGPEYAIGYSDGSVEVFAERGKLSRRVPGKGQSPLAVLRWPDSGPPRGIRIAGGIATVWEFGTSARAALRLPPTQVVAADLNLATGRIALGDAQGKVTVWSLAERSLHASIETGASGPIRQLAFSENGRELAASASEGRLGIWTIGEPAWRVKIPAEGATIVKFLGSDRIATAGRRGAIRIWNAATGQEEHLLLGHLGRVNAMAVSLDQRTLASGSIDGEVKLWDLHTGQELVGMQRHSGAVLAVEFSGDGRLLLTGGSSPGSHGELAFWDTKE